MAAPTCNFQQKPPWKPCSKGPFPTPQCPALSTPSSSPASHCQAGTRPGGQRALPPPHSWERAALLRSLKSLFSGSGRKQEEVGRAWRPPEHRGEARTADASATHGAMGSLPTPCTLPGLGQHRRVQGSLQRVPPCTQTPGSPGAPCSPGWQGTAMHPTAAGGDGCFAQRYKHGDCGWVHVLCSCIGEVHA